MNARRTIEVDEATALELEADAAARGVSVSQRLADLLASSREAGEWSESLKRLDEYDRTGEYVAVEDALRRFDIAVADATGPEAPVT